VDKLRVTTATDISDLRQEQNQEFNDMREEQRFKITSLMECINLVVQKNQTLIYDLASSENKIN
jgi:hypothetical protein